MKYLKSALRGMLYGIAVALARIADGAEWLSAKAMRGRDRLK